MGFGSFLKKAINPLTPFKAAGKLARGNVKGAIMDSATMGLGPKVGGKRPGGMGGPRGGFMPPAGAPPMKPGGAGPLAEAVLGAGKMGGFGGGFKRPAPSAPPALADGAEAMGPGSWGPPKGPEAMPDLGRMISMGMRGGGGWGA